jgi:hypothetical protein
MTVSADHYRSRAGSIHTYKAKSLVLCVNSETLSVQIFAHHRTHESQVPLRKRGTEPSCSSFRVLAANTHSSGIYWRLSGNVYCSGSYAYHVLTFNSSAFLLVFTCKLVPCDCVNNSPFLLPASQLSIHHQTLHHRVTTLQFTSVPNAVFLCTGKKTIQSSQANTHRPV